MFWVRNGNGGSVNFVVEVHFGRKPVLRAIRFAKRKADGDGIGPVFIAEKAIGIVVSRCSLVGDFDAKVLAYLNVGRQIDGEQII